MAADNVQQLPILLFRNQLAFEHWLEQHHIESPGIRVQIAKKNAGIATVSYDEAIESALCYGWIDNRKESYDEQTWLQRFSPRSARSIWSQVNKTKAEALIASGRMKPSGLAAIEAARRNGQWDKAYAGQSGMAVPEDLSAAMANNAQARAFFDTLDSRNRYAILFRIHQAKKPETRKKRIEQFVAMLERGEKIY